MKNLDLYDSFKEVPENAQKTIAGGRLKGKTDINPMWRIKVLTERFGPCGIGWKYSIKEKWLEKGHDNEVAAFIEIELFIKVDGEWSDAIPGLGGSSFITNEKNGTYTSDECYKMALTDAISVSCKALGIGANIYWEADSTKYQKNTGKKLLLPDRFNDPILFEWIYKHEKNSKARPFNLLDSNYSLSREEISKILSNYVKYKTLIKHEQPVTVTEHPVQ